MSLLQKYFANDAKTPINRVFSGLRVREKVFSFGVLQDAQITLFYHLIKYANMIEFI
jgi:hypothetical protein